MRRSSRKVTRSGTTLVLMPPLIRPTVELRAADALDVRDGAAQVLRQRVERGQDVGRGLQRVDAGLRHGGVRRAAGDQDFEMQAAVVRGDDGVGEAGADREVGRG